MVKDGRGPLLSESKTLLLRGDGVLCEAREAIDRKCHNRRPGHVLPLRSDRKGRKHDTEIQAEENFLIIVTIAVSRCA
jgi:hypothetical protein